MAGIKSENQKKKAAKKRAMKPILEMIQKYFDSDDREMWKLGQNLCHHYRMNYYVLIDKMSKVRSTNPTSWRYTASPVRYSLISTMKRPVDHGWYVGYGPDTRFKMYQIAFNRRYLKEKAKRARGPHPERINVIPGRFRPIKNNR